MSSAVYLHVFAAGLCSATELRSSSCTSV